MKIGELRKSGHWPSLLSAFLHFDTSFMIWVILGALMPFLASDPNLTGLNMKMTTKSSVTQAGQYTVLIKGPQTKAQMPALKADQPSHVYNLIIKPGSPDTATRASVKPIEKYIGLDNADPASIATVNAKSKIISLKLALGAKGNPNENVIALKPLSVLQKSGMAFQPIANGYPAGIKLLLIGIPLLAAGFWRILIGIFTDRFGAKRVGVVSMFVTLLPLLIGWKFATGYYAIVTMGFFLGLAGASFAVALPMASRWYPPHMQGLAMGIAGAGNSGTVLATLFAPLLAKVFGWHDVFMLMMIPVVIVLFVFALMSKDASVTSKPITAAGYLSVLAQADTWWFCLLYFVTFGGFVGMSSFLNTFFVDQFDAPKAIVGLWTWPFIIAGSLLRPVGGALADRIGGIRMLLALYGIVTLSAIGIGFTITNYAVTCALLFVMMGCLGMGNGSVFQLAPQRFKNQIGIITGIVGAAGGIGGYYLNFALGHLHDITQTYASGFYAFAAITVVAFAALRVIAPGWEKRWLGAGGVAQTETAAGGEHGYKPVPHIGELEPA